jgi:hypothetical protein
VRCRAFAAAVCAVTLICAAAPQTVTLSQVLAQISRLDEASLIAISNWASYPNPEAPDTSMSDLDSAEMAALKLSPQEQQALFTWLQHGGRSKLHALGISDAQIGPCQPLIDTGCASASVASAPGPHELAFQPQAQSAAGVDVSGGFAVLSADASALTHCISFGNRTRKTISAITFTYKLLSPAGAVLSAGSDVVVGSFQAGSQIASPSSAGELANATAGGEPPPANCWTKAVAPRAAGPAAPAAFTVVVSSVTFEDGSRWPQ